MEPLNNLKKIYGVSEKLERLIRLNAEPRVFKKNEYLQESISTGIFFIEEGLCRVFSVNKNNEVILQFKKENDVMFSQTGLVGEFYTSEYFQALEQTRVLFLNWTNVFSILNKLPEVNLFLQKLLISENANLTNLLKENRGLSALQRYDKIMAEAPYLIQRVPLNILAAYLGMTRETISRVRKLV